MEYPRQLKALIESFSKLPGVGRKTAERLAFHIFSDMTEEDTTLFATSLAEVKHSLKRCKICHNITDGNELCSICKDEERDQSLVMVVETIRDIFMMEKMQTFSGTYHVLNGAINFANGIGIEDLTIQDLLKRVEEGIIKEIILATNATVEGETTSRYIKALLDDKDVLITRIAHGLPVGGDIQYADEMTLLKAIEGRRKY